MLTIDVLDLTVGRGAMAVAGPLDFSLGAGEALVVTGPNGTGKSTLLRTLAGLLPPIAGAVTIAGATAPDGEPARTLSQIAHYVGHRNALKPTMRVGENLEFWRRYLGGPREGGRVLDDRQALEAVGLPDLAHLPCGYLSAGQQRRVSLARLLVSQRAVWILDEPTAALDAAAQERFGAILAGHLSEGGIVVAATHQPLAGLGAARELSLQSPRAGKSAAGSTPGKTTTEEDELLAAEGWL